MNILAPILISSTLAGFASQAIAVDKQVQASFDTTSVTEVIANPQKFSRKRISLKGFYSQIGQPYLFLSPAHERINDTESAISVLLVEPTNNINFMDNCSGNWLEVTGTLIPTVQDVTYRLSYRLAIDKATRLPDYVDCFSDTNENE
ncbi:hypothetical protein [Pseudoalteromonas ruthenica]|uniref:hypothetical protein n=1 Tax=Pseudoalteromonas ruthenica TaxID=151081 RepID=UPI00124720DB|nr:hypothetical protein [Pseudoalteromonas ruthenica]